MAVKIRLSEINSMPVYSTEGHWRMNEESIVLKVGMSMNVLKNERTGPFTISHLRSCSWVSEDRVSKLVFFYNHTSKKKILYYITERGNNDVFGKNLNYDSDWGW